jgi:hypothetical protein
MWTLAAKAYNSGVPLNTSLCDIPGHPVCPSALRELFSRVPRRTVMEDDDALHENRAVDCVREFSDSPDRSALCAAI